ncbi:ribonuclease Z [Encephalitozoon romaleae SJ-2008]|uniref:Ribonuclease Z n=1 Tax=Encephalitozoon romaleae (strain SJ-2008) TaxID=1178016 RepID=I7AEQ8_ENCRO|nr:ribonuclease Z [Encephalitozoon romaleae SJ-2008]AFN83130.1 ribonuclease Z [Encephalitozoon romaleae SJ-2008]
MSLSFSFLLTSSASLFHCLSVLTGIPNILRARASISLSPISDLLFFIFKSFHINSSSFIAIFSRPVNATSMDRSISVLAMDSWPTNVATVIYIQ